MNSAWTSSSSSSSPHSTISTHSLSSHSDSISSNSSSSSPIASSRKNRCEGLDLLVKAVYHVAGSIIGVPFVQRRVIRRRRRRRDFEFNEFIVSEIFNKNEEIEAEIEEIEEDEDEKKSDEEIVPKLKGKKRQRREMALPLKYQDSVLQPWKRQSRRR